MNELRQHRPVENVLQRLDLQGTAPGSVEIDLVHAGVLAESGQGEIHCSPLAADGFGRPLPNLAGVVDGRGSGRRRLLNGPHDKVHNRRGILQAVSPMACATLKNDRHVPSAGLFVAIPEQTGVLLIGHRLVAVTTDVDDWHVGLG